MSIIDSASRTSSSCEWVSVLARIDLICARIVSGARPRSAAISAIERQSTRWHRMSPSARVRSNACRRISQKPSGRRSPFEAARTRPVPSGAVQRCNRSTIRCPGPSPRRRSIAVSLRRSVNSMESAAPSAGRSSACSGRSASVACAPMPSTCRAAGFEARTVPLRSSTSAATRSNGASMASSPSAAPLSPVAARSRNSVARRKCAAICGSSSRRGALRSTCARKGATVLSQ